MSEEFVTTWMNLIRRLTEPHNIDDAVLSLFEAFDCAHWGISLSRYPLPFVASPKEG